MKLTPFDKLICRTPAFSINATLQENWEALKVKIEESSPTFFNEIKAINSQDIEQIDEKTKFTIWKYFNRAKFRSTPFGSFAAVSLAPINYQHHPIQLQQQIIQHQWVDWSEKDKLLVNPINAETFLHSNSSIYFVGEQLRYLKLSEDTFELASVNCFAELNAVVLFCKQKTLGADLLEFMKLSFSLAPKSTTQLIQQMIELQLLYSDLQPNITGEDYFTKKDIPTSEKPNNYIISERAVLSGNFQAKILTQLPAMVDFFSKYFFTSPNQYLLDFKKAFTQRFEQQEITLAQAMDPEIGIGYGELAHLSEIDPLVNELKENNGTKHQEKINYGTLQQFLMRKIIANQQIDLAAFQSEGIQDSILPNTFSLIFHLYKNRPVIAHCGGATANSLLGRFTLCSKGFEDYGKDIAKVEIDSNKEVVFFDIAYQAEKKVDNVNRRKHLYPYELPILSWSDTAAPLDFKDILVTVENDQIVLKSKKLGKRIIPRIPSAYNYTRSDLAAFRFLCDVQSQGLLTKLSFNLQELFPGLAHYPSVSYQNIIVCSAQWLLSKSVLTSLQSLKDWFEENNIPRRVKAGHSDQSLYFDSQISLDLWALYTYGKQQQADFYLTEALIDEKDCLADEKGNLYTTQYIANYYHNDEIYKASRPNISQKTIYHLPLDQWLYFEIYSHPAKSNYLLTQVIYKFLIKNTKAIKKWFFIRYIDPKPHIRLRIEVKNQQFATQLLYEFNQAINEEIKKGIVIDLQLKTYKPETQRYGAATMDLVEQFFHADSMYALHILKNSQPESQIIKEALVAIQHLCELCFNNSELELLFIKKMAQHFATEMNLNTLNFKKINATFNEIKGGIELTIKNQTTRVATKKKLLFLKIMQSCNSKEKQQKMLADLIHMFVNRLFITDQRIYETIIYHYLQRSIQTKLAKIKSPKERK